MTPGTFNVESVTLEHFPMCGFAILQVAVVYCDISGRLHRSCVGMPTDGLSIPRFFWRLIGAPIRNQYLLAGIVHDHYCLKAKSLPAGPLRNNLRASGDLLFREMVSVLGAGPLQAQILYSAVRIGAAASMYSPRIPDYIHEYDAFMEWYQGVTD